jgi:hypothetical protein
VEKRLASRRWRDLLPVRLGWAVAAFFCSATLACAFSLSSAEAERIGRKIWQNECNGTITGLTSWNEGENFASLGIGHFIWYAKGVRGPFDESFPKLVSFISRHGAKLPALLLAPNDLSCPWKTRADFMAAQNSNQMKQLRRFLADTVDLQAQFMVERLQNSLPKMLDQAPVAERDQIAKRFNDLGTSPAGAYALVDYVNFKGEGTLPTERYRGQGWGLLQVLQAMQGSSAAEFARAAETVLRRRVQNSPPERGESRWLSGWLNRIHSYTKE